MGVLAPGSAHADPPLGPPSTLAEIFRHTCLQTKLQNFRKNKQTNPKNRLGKGREGRGGDGGVKKKFTRNVIYISYKPMHKFETLGQTLIGF